MVASFLLSFSVLLLTTSSLASPPPPCDIHVCFAIDGSNTISSQIFTDERSLIVNTGGRLNARGGSVTYSSVQFSTSSSSIVSATTKFSEFEASVWNATQLPGEGTFITAGLNYCLTQLLSAPTNPAVVVVGTGVNTIGTEPAKRAELLRRAGIPIFSVGVGGNPELATLQNISDSPDKVLELVPNSSVWAVGRMLTEKLCPPPSQ